MKLAILPLTKFQTESYISSKQFKCFATEMAMKLGVDDLFSHVEYQKVAENFPNKHESLAFTHFRNKYTEYSGLYFLTDNITDAANSLSREYIEKDTKEEVLMTLIDFLLIHELVHVLQFKKGCAKELEKQESQSIQEYKNSFIEREANLIAYKYLRRRNPFTKKLLQKLLDFFYQ